MLHELRAGAQQVGKDITSQSSTDGYRRVALRRHACIHDAGMEQHLEGLQ